MTRTKSLPIRSSRKSLDPYPSPASLPEESNQSVGAGVISNKRYAPQFESDVEIVTDTFDGRNMPPRKKRHCVGINESDREGSQPLNLEACIVCEISDEWVSRCSGSDCIISFHGECLDAELGGSGGEDDSANLYCPYCWFKILSLRSIRLKEKVVEAEMAVFKYLDKEVGSRCEVEESVPKGQEDATTSGQELQGEKTAYSSEKDSDDEEKAVTENFQDAEDDKVEEKDNAVAGKERDASQFLSMQESFSGKEVQQNEKRRRKRRLLLNAFDSDVSSNGSTNEPNGEDAAAEKFTSLAVEVTSPSGKMNNQQRERSRTTKEDNSKTLRDISFFNKDQKRRLYWTPEEEYMLKVGVEKFSAEAKRNIPWRKILEMGQKVFHETRTPSDLKDKWRNMTGARLGKKNKQGTTQISGM